MFKLMVMNDAQKLHLATFVFVGEADQWGDLIERGCEENGKEVMWAMFKEEFENKFIPPYVQKQKASEFANLKQRSMTVAEYEAKFTILARHAPRLVVTDEEKAKWFEEGLSLLGHLFWTRWLHSD